MELRNASGCVNGVNILLQKKIEITGSIPDCKTNNTVLFLNPEDYHFEFIQENIKKQSPQLVYDKVQYLLLPSWYNHLDFIYSCNRISTLLSMELNKWQQ